MSVLYSWLACSLCSLTVVQNRVWGLEGGRNRRLVLYKQASALPC